MQIWRPLVLVVAILALFAAASGHKILDGDGDGVRNSKDMCPRTPPDTPVDNNGCSKQQLDEDGDGICNPDRPRYKTGPRKGTTVPTFKNWCTGRDNCKHVYNPSQARNFSKRRGDACNRDRCHEACRGGCDAPGANVTSRGDILACTSAGPLTALHFTTRCKKPYLPIMTSPYGCYHPSSPPTEGSAPDVVSDSDSDSDDEFVDDDDYLSSDSGSDEDDGLIGSDSGSGTTGDGSEEFGSGSGSEDYYFEDTVTATATAVDSLSSTPAASPTAAPSTEVAVSPLASNSAEPSPTPTGNSGGNGGNLGKTAGASTTSGSSNTATIAGVVIGVGVALIALLAFLIIRKRREVAKPRQNPMFSSKKAPISDKQHVRPLSNLWDTGVNTLTDNQVEKVVAMPDSERPTVFGPEDIVHNGIDVSIPLDVAVNVPSSVLLSPPAGLPQPKAIRVGKGGQDGAVGRDGKRRVRRVVKKVRRNLSSNSEDDGIPLNEM